MSEIIRTLAGITVRSADVQAATTSQLARLAHQAEDTDNDVLLCDVWAEVEQREVRVPGTHNLFGQLYREQMAERARERRGT